MAARESRADVSLASGERRTAAPARPRAILTVKEIPAAIKLAISSGKDVWLTEKGQRGVGRLVCRCTAAGSAILMYRYTEPDGARRVISIGAYAADGVGGYTLEQARIERDKLAKRLQAGSGMLHRRKP